MDAAKTSSQSELNRLYLTLKSKASALPEAVCRRLSPPLLLHVTPAWEQSRHRVLVVGQETRGWGEWDSPKFGYSWPYPQIDTFWDFLRVANSVEALVDGYRQWNFASSAIRVYPHVYNGPFWAAYRQIRSAAGETAQGITTGVLSTNLVRVAMSREGSDFGSIIYTNGPKEEIDLVLTVTAGILAGEIEILRPHAVIFLTGPYYDDVLRSEFPGAFFQAFETFELKQAAYLAHKDLPALSVRTYHPVALRRLRLSAILDKINALVADLAHNCENSDPVEPSK